MSETLTRKPLDSLAAELWDFLGLAPDLDLPALRKIELKRWSDDAGWKASALVERRSTADAIEAVYAYAAYAGGSVHITTPFPCTAQPSGMQVALSAFIVIAEVAIEIGANLDADQYAEAMVADRAETAGGAR
jgi:hypothetical protein